jgi:hypothetical protein
MEVSGQLHATSALSPRKEPRTHWVWSWVGFTVSAWTFLLLLGSQPRIVQPVASHSNGEKVFVTVNVFGKCRVSNVGQDWMASLWVKMWYIYVCVCVCVYLTAVGLTPGGSNTVHIYTPTVHRIQRRNIHNNKKLTNLGSTGRAPSLTSYTLAFALQLRKKHGKTSVTVAVRLTVRFFNTSVRTSRPGMTRFFLRLNRCLTSQVSHSGFCR